MNESLVYREGKVVYAATLTMTVSTEKIRVKTGLKLLIDDFFLAYQKETSDFFICFTQKNGDTMYLQAFNDLARLCASYGQDDIFIIKQKCLNTFISRCNIHVELSKDGLFLLANCDNERLSTAIACNKDALKAISDEYCSDEYLTTSETVSLIQKLGKWHDHKAVASICRILIDQHKKKATLDMLAHIKKRKACPEEALEIIAEALQAD